MDETLQQKLRNIDPDFFRRFSYIGVGNGWYPLIEALLSIASEQKSRELEQQGPCNHNDDLEEYQCNKTWAHFMIEDIKEKYGSLRFYHIGGDVSFYQFVDFAEVLSQRMCEVCGRHGFLRDRNAWYVTRCDEHFNKGETGGNETVFAHGLQ